MDMTVEMNRLLVIWICEKEMQGESVSFQFICDTARETSEDLKCSSPQSCSSQFEELKAHKGWFKKFKKTAEIRSVFKVCGGYQCR